MDIEDCFGIKNESSDNLDLPMTVNGLSDLVKIKLGERNHETLVEMAVFRAIQNGFEKYFGLDGRIRPSDKLRDLNSKSLGMVLKRWNRFSYYVGMKMPDTVFPKEYINCLAVLTIVVLFLFFHFEILGFIPYGLLIILTIHFVISRKLKNVPNISVRELVYLVIMKNMDIIKIKYGNIPNHLIYKIVCMIISDRLSIDHNRIKPDSKIIDDLGAD